MQCTATPAAGQLSPEQTQALTEARDRLRRARLAFSAFMTLVKDGESLNGEALYCLLEPLEAELDAGVQCLAVVGVRA